LTFCPKAPIDVSFNTTPKQSLKSQKQPVTVTISVLSLTPIFSLFTLCHFPTTRFFLSHQSSTENNTTISSMTKNKKLICSVTCSVFYN